VVFADAKQIQTDFVSQRDCFKEFAEMPRGVDCRHAVNGCRYETVYADLHAFVTSRYCSIEVPPTGEEARRPSLLQTVAERLL
jgi:hypothetical protein